MASYIGDEDANLHLHLEYAANIDASNETIGRKCTLPVHLLFLPSLEVRLPLLLESLLRILHFLPIKKLQQSRGNPHGTMQVTSVTFHEHHLLADVRAPDMGSKGPGMRRSSSLSAINRSFSARYATETFHHSSTVGSKARQLQKPFQFVEMCCALVTPVHSGVPLHAVRIGHACPSCRMRTAALPHTQILACRGCA